MYESYPHKTTIRQISSYIDSRFPGIYYMANTPVATTSVGNVTRSGTSNPNWQHQIAKRVDASTDYSRTGIETKPAFVLCDAMMDYPSWKIYGYNRMITLAGHPAIDFNQSRSDVDDIALKRIKRKLSASQGLFNAMLPLAEIRELRRTVRGATEYTGFYLQKMLALRKRLSSSKKADLLVRHAADKWLTYSFGVAPIISDIGDIANSINARLSKDIPVLRLQGSAGTKWQESGKTTGITGCYSADLNASHFTEHTYKVKYVCGLDLAISSANSYSISDQFGFVKENFVPTLWELIPYSWIADYFTTAGEFLEDAFSANAGNTVYLTKNTLYRFESRGHYWHVRWTADWPYHKILRQIEGNSSISAFSFKRTKLSSLPHRSFRLRTVDEIGRNAVTKLLNLAAVFALKRRN